MKFNNLLQVIALFNVNYSHFQSFYILYFVLAEFLNKFIKNDVFDCDYWLNDIIYLHLDEVDEEIWTVTLLVTGRRSVWQY